MAGVAGRSGRKRKTIDEHKRDGSYRHDRHGKCVDAVLSPVKLDPPDSLGDIGKALWLKLQAELPESLFTAPTYEGLLAYCETWELVRAVTPLLRDDPGNKDIRLAYNSAMQNFHILGRQWGYTPPAVASLKLPDKGEKEKTAFDEWLEKASNERN